MTLLVPGAETKSGHTLLPERLRAWTIAGLGLRRQGRMNVE